MTRVPKRPVWSALQLVFLVLAWALQPLAAVASRQDESRRIPFTDIEGHWAENAITSAVAAGYLTGYPDRTFRPDGSVTRVEAVAMIVRALTAAHVMTPVPDGYANMPDIFMDGNPQHWGIRMGLLPTAVATGLVTQDDLHDGTTPTFAPDSAATRIEVTIWLARVVNPALESYIQIQKTRDGEGWSAAARQAATIPGTDTPWPYTDSVLAERKVYVWTVSRASVVQGYPDGRFVGDGAITRAELVTMLQRLAPVAALVAPRPADDDSAPADPVHGLVTEVREGGAVNRLSLVPRSLRGDRPTDWPAVRRLLAALSTAQKEPLPSGAFEAPDGPNQTWLEIAYADGTVKAIYPLLRCEAYAGGRQCSSEPGWVVSPSGPVYSVALWEYVYGQRQFDMPLLARNQ